MAGFTKPAWWKWALLAICVGVQPQCGLGGSTFKHPGPVYRDPLEVYPQMKSLFDDWEAMRDEVLALEWSQVNEAVFERHLYNAHKGQSWKQLHLVYRADGLGFLWHKEHLRKMPTVRKNLRKIAPILNQAVISRVGARTLVKPHQGYIRQSNRSLRCHVSLRIPKGKPPKSLPALGKIYEVGGLPTKPNGQAKYDRKNTTCCGMVVEDEVVFHREGSPLLFDDTHLHYAFNNAKEERFILLIDLVRPYGDTPDGFSMIDEKAENIHFGIQMFDTALVDLVSGVMFGGAGMTMLHPGYSALANPHDRRVCVWNPVAAQTKANELLQYWSRPRPYRPSNLPTMGLW